MNRSRRKSALSECYVLEAHSVVTAAAADLEEILGYLDEHHPSLAQSTVVALFKAASSLKNSPHRGRLGKEAGTRELLISPLPYIIVYGVDPQVVHIFRIMHTSRKRPS